MAVIVQVRSGYRYTTTSEIFTLECSECSIMWGIPDDFDDRRRKDGRTFYCPNGHSQVYNKGQSEAQLLNKRLEAEKANSRWYADQLTAACNDAKSERRRAAAARGQLTKIKNRIAVGVCPVPKCKRSGLGSDVVRHIETCHPNWHGHEQ